MLYETRMLEREQDAIKKTVDFNFYQFIFLRKVKHNTGFHNQASSLENLVI